VSGSTVTRLPSASNNAISAHRYLQASNLLTVLWFIHLPKHAKCTCDEKHLIASKDEPFCVPVCRMRHGVILVALVATLLCACAHAQKVCWCCIVLFLVLPSCANIQRATFPQPGEDKLHQLLQRTAQRAFITLNTPDFHRYVGEGPRPYDLFLYLTSEHGGCNMCMYEHPHPNCTSNASGIAERTACLVLSGNFDRKLKWQQTLMKARDTLPTTPIATTRCTPSSSSSWVNTDLRCVHFVLCYPYDAMVAFGIVRLRRNAMFVDRWLAQLRTLPAIGLADGAPSGVHPGHHIRQEA